MLAVIVKKESELLTVYIKLKIIVYLISLIGDIKVIVLCLYGNDR